MGGTCSTYGRDNKCIKDCCGETWGKEPFGRPRHRWEDSIKIDLKEVGGGMGRIDRAQDRVRWWAVVNVLMTFLVPCNAGNICDWGPVSFSRRTVLHGVILFDFTQLFSVQSLLAHLMRTAYVMTGIRRFLTYSHSLSAFCFCRMLQKITEMSLFIQGELFHDQFCR
jgi:hypothetical protein